MRAWRAARVEPEVVGAGQAEGCSVVLARGAANKKLRSALRLQAQRLG